MGEKCWRLRSCLLFVHIPSEKHGSGIKEGCAAGFGEGLPAFFACGLFLSTLCRNQSGSLQKSVKVRLERVKKRVTLNAHTGNTRGFNSKVHNGLGH